MILDASIVWDKSINVLKTHLDPQIFSAWIKPLSISRVSVNNSSAESPAAMVVNGRAPSSSALSPNVSTQTAPAPGSEIELEAPNKFCCEHVEQYYGKLISNTLSTVTGLKNLTVRFRVKRDIGLSGRNAPKPTTNFVRASDTLDSIYRPRPAVLPERADASTNSSSPEASAAKAVFDLASSFSTDSSAVTTSVLDSEIQKNQAAAGAKARGVVKKSSDAMTRARYGRGADDTNLNPKYNFSNFVIGSCNQFAHAVALRVSQNLGACYNPLFIYGGVGLGKTHMVNAIGNTAKRQGKRVLLVSSEVFVNELIAAIRANKMPQFKSRFRSLDLLIVDDIQFIIGKERTQEEFFHTFNDLHQRHRQIIITSDKVPQELTGLEERLRTRFASGLSVDIQAPDFETRVAIVRSKAEATGVNLSEDVARVLAEKVSTNVRELEGALNRLLALSSMNNGGPVTADYAAEALKTLLPEKIKEITPELIQKVVSERYNIGLSELLGKRRTQNIAFARHVAMYMCRKMTSCSYPEIGALFGGRDHSTVIHATRMMDVRLKASEQFRSDLSALENRIKN